MEFPAWFCPITNSVMDGKIFILLILAYRKYCSIMGKVTISLTQISYFKNGYIFRGTNSAISFLSTFSVRVNS